MNLWLASQESLQRKVCRSKTPRKSRMEGGRARHLAWSRGQSESARGRSERIAHVAFDGNVVGDDDAHEVVRVRDLLERGAVTRAVGDEADARGARNLGSSRGLRHVLEHEAAETGLVL